MGLELTDIVAEFGAYYLNNGQNQQRILSMLFTKSKTEELLTTRITEETRWRAAKDTISELLQPFQKVWTPKGTHNFEPLEIILFKMKIDFELYPDDLEETWLGFLADNELDRKVWPIVRYLVEMKIIPKLHEEFELQCIFWGKREEPANGVPGLAWQSMDGLRKARNASVLAGNTTPITIGAWEAANSDLVDQFEEFGDGIPKNYWEIPMILACNPDLARRHRRGTRAKYGKDTDFNGTFSTISETNITVVGLQSMTGSDAIWCTTPENAIRLIKKQENIKKLRVENIDRLVKLYNDFSKGAGFAMGEILFTNDLDDGTPTFTALSGAPVAAGGQELTIEGLDFTGVTEVLLGDQACTAVTLVNDRKITCTSPAIAADDYTVSVTTPYGTGVSTLEITVGA